ncbi:Short-chain dehydrogenase/reductase SDR [Penicillium griseofulvum]|uniref:Short-chain dehydrogenase/reductase SDR n=1 Tax=Penicillium patulum TaxID=5078 RepID=A0A135LC34_PENPA|nr:Short-chain dehydrogenase/reductase SDR [Penicillium griseofulvum]KXG46527.1 Short-chain dehydrogenase/reductase SDR [Penicillium griseofulvum]
MDINGYALVTGAGSGIGRACALAFALEGAAGIVFADLNQDSAEKAAEESKKLATNAGYQALVLTLDVTNEEQVESVVAKTKESFGRIDYMVNSAGIGVQVPAEIAEASLVEFTRFLDVNVKGSFLLTKIVSRAMKEQEAKAVSSTNPNRGSTRGVILNMASCSSFVATPLLTQYTTSKHAVLGLTRNAALDNAKYNIRVNCLCPSWVDTPMVDRAVQGNPDLKELIAKAVPMGRIAHVDEITDLIMFLCSSKASYVTGSSWIVDGGTTLTSHV